MHLRAYLVSVLAILLLAPYSWAQSRVGPAGHGFRGGASPGVRITPRGAPFHRGPFRPGGGSHGFRSGIRPLGGRFNPFYRGYGGFYYPGYYSFYSPYLSLPPYPYEYVPECSEPCGCQGSTCAGPAQDSSGYGDAAFHIVSPDEAAAAIQPKAAPGHELLYPSYVLLRFRAPETAPGSSGNPLVIPPYHPAHQTPRGEMK